jgi:RND family efflux transporter MFP subunit
MVVNRTNGNGVETIPVQRHTVTKTVAASGNVKAQGVAEMYSSSTGIITELYVSDGDTVIEGQELFAVKSTATEQEEQAAYAAYLAATTSVNAAKSTANSLRSTMYEEWDEYFNLATNDTYEEEDGAPKEHERTAAEFQTSKYDWLAAESTYKDQQKAIASAQSNAAALWTVYQTTQDSVTTAPSAGVIANIDPSVGDRVTALPSTKATPVLSLTNFESFYVDIDIKETDIPFITVGQEATILLDALPDQTFAGRITTIDSLGIQKAGVVNYTVKILLTDTHPDIRHMMTATAEIQITEQPNVRSIPPAALKEQDGAKGAHVYTAGTTEWRPILIGTRGDKWIEVLDGLEEGEEVVIGTVE